MERGSGRGGGRRREGERERESGAEGKRERESGGAREREIIKYKQVDIGRTEATVRNSLKHSRRRRVSIL